jgi:SMI1/KNR4 family protein SUKH-1
MPDIARVLDKLERLRDADQELSLYGAHQHRYRLGPPLADGDLRRFERQHRMSLPVEYRAFLLQAGNGGAGPYAGLLPLEAALISADEGFLARPFPYRHWWNGVSPPDWWELPNAHELDERSAPHEADYSANVRVQGTLRLAHEGCGYYCILVVSGAERGHVWGDERAGDGGIMPLPYRPGPYQIEGSSLLPISGATARMTFLEWYEDWLDTSLQRTLTKTPPGDG